MNKNKNTKERLLLFVIISFFLIFGGFLSLNIKKNISPDERYHTNVSKFYSETLLIPDNSKDTYAYGDITRIPYLSFWLNARLININVIGVEDYIVLRFFNLIISTGSLLIIYFISKEVINKKYLNLLPVFLLANTLMYVFLSSAVSYDNLSNFFVFVSFYFYIKFIKTNKPPYIIYLLVSQILGLLTKFTIAPVVLIEFILLVCFVIKRGDFKKIFRSLYTKHKKLLIFNLIIFSLGFLLYGVNVIQYGSLTVHCDKVLTVDQCMENGIYSRANSLKDYTPESINGFLDLLKDRLTPFEYLSTWVLEMTQRIFGVLGHKSLLMHKYFANIYIFLFALLSGIVIHKWEKKDYLESNLMIISSFYILTLLIYQNYRLYMKTGILGLALQGRYLFPVVSLIYIIVVRYLKDLKLRLLKWVIIIFMLMLFTCGCIPFFFKFIPKDWFM